MFKTIVATASFALLAVSMSSSAHAGGMKGTGGINGTSLNGLGINGMGLNAITANAITSNALGTNGVNSNGTAPAASSFTIDGVELPAQAR